MRGNRREHKYIRGVDGHSMSSSSGNPPSGSVNVCVSVDKPSRLEEDDEDDIAMGGAGSACETLPAFVLDAESAYVSTISNPPTIASLADDK